MNSAVAQEYGEEVRDNKGIDSLALSNCLDRVGKAQVV